MRIFNVYVRKMTLGKIYIEIVIICVSFRVAESYEKISTSTPNFSNIRFQSPNLGIFEVLLRLVHSNILNTNDLNSLNIFFIFNNLLHL